MMQYALGAVAVQCLSNINAEIQQFSMVLHLSTTETNSNNLQVLL